MRKVTIVGAGPVGSLLGILLSRRGYAVDIYERRPDPKSGRIVGGRSINLALSDRGLLALERAGIREDVEKVAIPMKGRMMHARDGALAFQPYGTDEQAIRSVSRGGLNVALIELVRREKNVRMVFERKCVGADVHKPSCTLESPTGERVEVETDILIGADGAFSAVRYDMQRLDRFEYAQSYIEHGYKELTISPGSGLEKHALHIWPREDFMLIALPNADDTFTCTLFLSLEGPRSFSTVPTAKEARSFFADTFPDALPLMKSFDADWKNNPVSSMCMIRCFPWSFEGKALLIGDAAHAIVPFFGQGLNAGFEDCRVLLETLDDTRADGKDDWRAAMQRFERVRKPNADAILELALENFVEMRDKVADPSFLLRKKIEAYVGKLCPQQFTPLYTLVTFSPHVGYAEAQRRGRMQDRVLDRICALPDIAETFASGARDAEIKDIVTTTK